MKTLAIALATTGALSALATAKDRAPELLLNEIQVVGTHNSYSQGIDPRLMAMAEAIVGPKLMARNASLTGAAKAAGLEYHPNPGSLSQGLNYRYTSLASQLDAGMRSLEIDINNDPDGGRYAHPAGYAALKAKGIVDPLPLDKTDMDKPGLKVFHIADFDVRSSCNLFRTCLGQLRTWSDAHPNHEPIFILVEAKSDPLPIFRGSTKPLPFDAKAFAEMDASIYDVIGRDHLVTPDAVRGGYATLEAGVRAHHWPTLQAARGKFVFLLLTALDPIALAAYHEGHPNLEGRAAFLRASPGDNYAAFLLMDNATMRAKEIPALVEQGYLVRARADIETFEARINDPARATQAFRSGAQIVSTDFYRPGNGYGTSYVVRLPGGGAARCNPVNAPAGCALPR
ncbi:Ca2+-dependent phosphoinositide-specific phospholipase C [Sphingomonas faeni]|uniref:Ca2+-dependent phosphoinositide-specific phospholipase C n=1 Tax=Sphingomonas faeni TaxID=185950 RepID=UPI0020C08D08|nr:Ca2+-dependent phosphoinositide-specific phospholipase C [Sphingomonas faeni]MCK8455181.1 phosphatidylinositol-specific phospholipase C1-like protein [Sphingomonas faeni]